MDSAYVQAHAHRTDEFGRSVAIESDMLAVGAPCHDFETIHQHLFYSDTAFIRKDFNAEFKIHTHDYFDLGCSGTRIDKFNRASGNLVLNNGAVFTFKRRITDWPNRIKEWEVAEKITAQGHSDRNKSLSPASGTENDFFGTSVDLHRAKRGDSDYTLVAGAPYHRFATSGNHSTSQPLDHAGAAYTFDAMLREQIPSIPRSTSWMTTRVFGDSASGHLNTLTLEVSQNATGDPITYEASGIVMSNVNGDIFVEVSGYDASPKGFTSQRPYVVSVIGESLPGTPIDGSMGLIISGIPVPISGNMNLMLSGAPSANVYNNMNIYTSGDIVQSEQMNLHTSGPLALTGSMNMMTSGHNPNEEQLNLGVRGK